MILDIKIYDLVCDRCNKPFKSKHSSTSWKTRLQNESKDKGWAIAGDKHYCPNCFIVDKNGNKILKV